MSLYSYFEQKLNRPDLGLLILRVVFGLFILNAGVMKLLDIKHIDQVGGAMAMFGITWKPELWGLLAALAETLGGICVLLGLFFRPALVFLVFTMIVASAAMWGAGPNFSKMEEFQKFLGNFMMPAVFLAAFLCLLFTGPGKYVVHLKTGSGGRSSGGSKSAKE